MHELEAKYAKSAQAGQIHLEDDQDNEWDSIAPVMMEVKKNGIALHQ